MSLLARALLISVTVAACKNERKLEPSPATTIWIPDHARGALAGSFLGGNRSALKLWLHDSIIVQPPPPDSARQGPDAISYLQGLADSTTLRDSWLVPTAVVPEGPFLFEQGIWYVRARDRGLRGNYTIRWLDDPEGLKVVLWRWSRFR